jgi:glycosyltransferase involved in cell wall biosynthesis
MLNRLPIPLKWRLLFVHSSLELLCGLRGASSVFADTRDVRRGDLLISGFLGEAIGVGRAADLTRNALRDAGLVCKEHNLRNSFSKILFGAPGPHEGKPSGVWIQHANAPEGMVADLALGPQRGRYRIGYWAWETSVAPAQWARRVPFYHEVWVPSVFCAESLKASLHNNGLDVFSDRIRVMPHPLPEPQPAAPDPARFGLNPSAVKALCLFDARSAFARKNPWGAIAAWCDAVPEPDPARAQLLVKCLAGDVATRDGARLRALIARRPDLVLLTERLSDADMDGLLESVDLLISLHRSEGFGLSLAEAMLCGKAVVATGWSGNLDFMTDENSVLITARAIPVSDPGGTYRCGQWAEPDHRAAAEAIRALLESPDRRRQIGAQARCIGAGLRAPWQAEALRVLPFSAWIDPS